VITVAARRIILTIALAAIALSTGCKKDDDVQATLDFLDETTDGIIAKIKDAKDPKAGVAEATELLESKSSELKEQMTALGELRGFQVSDEMQAKMGENITANVTKIQKLKLAFVSLSVQDKAFDAALNKLVDDYTAAVTPGG